MLGSMTSRSKRVFHITLVSVCCLLLCNGALAADKTFNLLKGLNGISVPFDGTGISNAEQLCQAISKCVSVATWDASAQQFVKHELGAYANNFSVQPAHPYFVSVSQDTSWTVTGSLPDSVTFDLVTTTGTSINTIALPLNLSNIQTAEDLINIVPNGDAVWYWNAERQGYVGHPKGSQINNFSVSPGYAYFVSVTSDAQWAIQVTFKASLSAAPQKGGIPLEVAFVALAGGGTPPYTYSWDLNNDGTVDDTRDRFNYVFLEYGIFQVTLTVRDSTNKAITHKVSISALSAPSVLASATPSEGAAPLDVVLSAVASDPDGTIVLYQWDFDGDGNFDYSSTVSPTVTHTYPNNGLYHATLRVTDNDGLWSTSSVDIAAGARPKAKATATPTSGKAPLNVTLGATGSDSDGSVVLYELDFDGDGTYDYSTDTNGTTTHTYDMGGFFNATLRVTDNDGLIATDSVLISVSAPPIALARAYPLSGPAPLTVTFFANGKDTDGSPEYYDWDYNGDGTWDVRLIASMNSTYTYTKPGTYTATLKVTDNEKLTGTASVTITVTESTSTDTPTATASALPNNGAAPLTVMLIGDGSAKSGKLTKYEWDFEGDGTYDWAEAVVAGGPLGNPIKVNSSSIPAFADIDGDGDLDLYVGEYYGSITYFRNDGTASAPVWTAVGQVKDASGATIDVGYNSSPVFADINGDGKLDLFIGEYYGTVSWYKNDGTTGAPVWTPKGQLKDASGATIDVGYNSVPVLADMNGDGKLDLFVGEYYGTISWFRNDGTAGAPVWTSMGQLKDASATAIDVGYSSSPVFADMNGDGKLDLLIGEYYGTIYWYKNDGTASDPVWTSMGQLKDAAGNNLTAGYYSRPVLEDVDGDGKKDLFIGENSGYLWYFKNSGTTSAPVWTLMASKYGAVAVSYYASPAFADVDGDGDLDLFVGANDGTTIFFRNDGSKNQPVWTPMGPLMDKDGKVIKYYSYYGSTPTLVDIDGDGDLDLFIGEYYGTIYFYRNDGTKSAPVWTPMGQLKDDKGSTIDVGYSSSPAFVDIDGDGILDLFVGDYYGSLYYYHNTGTATAPKFVSMGQVKDATGTNISVYYNAVPRFADIDFDGDLDLFIGDYGGNLAFYRNDGGSTSPLWSFVTKNYRSISLPNNTAPAFADIDNDGDPDLFVGNYSGFVYYYPTQGTVIHVYPSMGTYNATLRVTDDSSKTGTDSVTVKVYDTGTPTAVAMASPSSGNVPLTVNFSGKGVVKDSTITLYEWDFNGDGTYDWSSATSGNTSTTYNGVGTNTATLRVTAANGKQATDSVVIHTSLKLTSTRTTIFNPSGGETGSIGFTLSGDAKVTLEIIDAYENHVRTLINNANRKAGSYSVTWDGKDDNGKQVKDGIYYYILKYTSGAESGVHDLRSSSTYTETTPDRTWATNFDPFQDQFVQSEFTISKPAEVSMYLWKRDYSRPESSISPVRTLFERYPMAAGKHTAIWDGVDDKGIVAGPWSGGYPITLWVYDLADNAIIITGNTPEISNVSADPNYFSPAYNPYAASATPYTTASFTLSKGADLQVRVINSSGLTVRTMNKPDLPAGANTVLWDGKDFDGKLCGKGAYAISLIAVDDLGNRSLSRYASVFVYY